MNKQDKDSILILIFTLGYFGLFAVFVFGMKLIPIQYIAPILIAIEEFYIKPIVIKLYYELYDMKADVTRFIPIYNQLMIFRGKIAICYLVLSIISGLCILLMCFPGTISAILPDALALNFGVNIMRVTVVVLFIYNVVVYIGYLSVFSDIDAQHYKITSRTALPALRRVILYFTLFIPLVRSIGLLSIHNVLNRIVKFSHITVNTVFDEELREEI